MFEMKPHDHLLTTCQPAVISQWAYGFTVSSVSLSSCFFTTNMPEMLILRLQTGTSETSGSCPSFIVLCQLLSLFDVTESGSSFYGHTRHTGVDCDHRRPIHLLFAAFVYKGEQIKGRFPSKAKIIFFRQYIKSAYNINRDFLFVC